MTKRKVNQELYNFVLVLEGISKYDGRLEDSLFEAGCDDAMLSFQNGVAYLEFDREAESLESAILRAVREVEMAECEAAVSHVEPADVVNASEIARRLRKTREYVRLLARGDRGEGGFPSPLSGVTGKTWLWSWASVVRWLVRHDKVDDGTCLNKAETIRDINGVLRDRLQPAVIARRKSLLRMLRRA